MSTDRDDLTRVVAEALTRVRFKHQRDRPGAQCHCGRWTRWDGESFSHHLERERADALAPLLAEARREAAAETLERAADALGPVIRSPCPEEVRDDCCGARCDAEMPTYRMVGADWLRARAEAVREGR